MNENTARAFATVGIWASLAFALAFGVFRLNWSGDAVFMLVVIVLGMAAAAAGGTVAVWAKSGLPKDSGPPDAEFKSESHHFKA
jgi:hypothetical protein